MEDYFAVRGVSFSQICEIVRLAKVDRNFQTSGDLTAPLDRHSQNTHGVI